MPKKSKKFEDFCCGLCESKEYRNVAGYFYSCLKCSAIFLSPRQFTEETKRLREAINEFGSLKGRIKDMADDCDKHFRTRAPFPR